MGSFIKAVSSQKINLIGGAYFVSPAVG